MANIKKIIVKEIDPKVVVSETALNVMKNLHRQAHELFELLTDEDKKKWNYWIAH